MHCRPEDKSIHLIKNKKNMIYKVIKKKNPKNVEEPGKYYGCLVSPSLISIDEIATRISATCTVTRHDCLAVLSALQEQIIFALQEGKRVGLGDIGYFRTVINGSGSDTEEAYNTSYFKSMKVRFIPNKELKNALSLNNEAISFQRIKLVEKTAGTGTVQN